RGQPIPTSHRSPAAPQVSGGQKPPTGSLLQNVRLSASVGRSPPALVMKPVPGLVGSAENTSSPIGQEQVASVTCVPSSLVTGRIWSHAKLKQFTKRSPSRRSAVQVELILES